MKFAMKSFIGMAMLAASSTAFAVYFNSPSGNIMCQGDEFENGSVGCFIAQTNTRKPPLPMPRDCHGDWGQDFGVAYHSKKGYMSCVSDFMYNPSAQVLNYGKSINGNGWTCTSQSNGMRCVNKSGHGFHLSRNKQSVF